MAAGVLQREAGDEEAASAWTDHPAENCTEQQGNSWAMVRAAAALSHELYAVERAGAAERVLCARSSAGTRPCWRSRSYGTGLRRTC